MFPSIRPSTIDSDASLMLILALQKSWCKETSYDGLNWSESNPSYGQCAVSCMVYNDYIQSNIASGYVYTKGGIVEHYWLRLFNNTYGEYNLDMTRAQFDKIYLCKFSNYITPATLRRDNDTYWRYRILRDKVKAILNEPPIVQIAW